MAKQRFEYKLNLGKHPITGETIAARSTAAKACGTPRRRPRRSSVNMSWR